MLKLSLLIYGEKKKSPEKRWKPRENGGRVDLLGKRERANEFNEEFEDMIMRVYCHVRMKSVRWTGQSICNYVRVHQLDPANCFLIFLYYQPYNENRVLVRWLYSNGKIYQIMNFLPLIISWEKK